MQDTADDSEWCPLLPSPSIIEIRYTLCLPSQQCSFKCGGTWGFELCRLGSRRWAPFQCARSSLYTFPRSCHWMSNPRFWSSVWVYRSMRSMEQIFRYDKSFIKFFVPFGDLMVVCQAWKVSEMQFCPHPVVRTLCAVIMHYSEASNCIGSI